MPYRKRDLIGLVVPTNPPLAPLTGGKVGKADRVASVFAEQDRILGHGRRIVAQVGLNGADAFLVPSTDPDTGLLTADYPTPTAVRVAYRGKFSLTPGHMLRAVAVVIPSGATQRLDLVPEPGYVNGGGGGSIVIEAMFTNSGGSETLTASLQTPVSGNQYQGESTTAGAVWAEAHRLRSGLIRPDMPDAATTASWSDGVEVELSIAFKGGVRPISVIVHEEPYIYARSFSDGDWASSIFTNGAGLPLSKYPVPWPVSSTGINGDTSGGTNMLIDTAARQTRTLGPMLVTATAWNEASQSISATETVEKTTSSTTLVDLWRTAITGWSSGYAGWSMSSGGNAPQWNTAGPKLELRDKARVVPVRVRVYCKKSGTGTGALRVMTQVYSLCDLVVTNTSWTWVETTAHLKCGFGPEDASTLIVLGNVTAGTATLLVRYVQVEHIDV